MRILPDVLLLVLSLLVMGLDLLLSRKRQALLGWVTAIGLLGVIVATLLTADRYTGGWVIAVLRADTLALVGRIVLLACAFLVTLLSIDSEGVGRRGEYYALMLLSTIGMCWMVSAIDLVMLALGLELTTIPLYILAGFLKRDSRSTEAGLKYFLFGAAASAVMLYGFSFLYGLTGQTAFNEIGWSLANMSVPMLLVVAAAVLILVGVGFKLAAVPFHFWAPDVYEGAPTPVTAFLSTASKAAGFVVLMRLFFAVIPLPVANYWGALVAGMSVAAMTVGNLLAIPQKNIKRLLAYSSIAHAGYALIGVVAISPEGLASTLFYLLVYTITNIAAFAVVILVSRAEGTEEISGFAGLSRRSPWAALALLVAFLSLSGMPPFGGFVAKLFVFASAVQGGFVWLAAIGVINSIVGLYYYLTVLKVAYLYRSESEKRVFPFPISMRVALLLSCIFVIVVGVVVSPWFDWAMKAATGLWKG